MNTFRGAYCIGGVDLSITTDLTCASLLFMKRGSEQKYVAQMYWLPADNLRERVQQDKIPYDKWLERGLMRLCAGNTINYSDVTAWFTETVKQYELFPAWVYYDSYSHGILWKKCKCRASTWFGVYRARKRCPCLCRCWARTCRRIKSTTTITLF